MFYNCLWSLHNGQNQKSATIIVWIEPKGLNLASLGFEFASPSFACIVCVAFLNH
jgi:hypothetical protein